MPLNPVPTIPADAPKPGSIWRHFKGHAIEVHDVFIHTETGEIIVAYRVGDERWARPLAMFLDTHASGVKRFVHIYGPL